MRQTIFGSRCFSTSIFSGLLLLVASASASTIIPFDPDGAGPDPVVQVSSVDFKVGNSLYKGIGNLLVNGTPTTVHYAQASVDGLLDSNGNTIPVNGLGTPTGFQLTMVLGFTANATISGTTTQYTLGAAPNVNFFQLWYNPTRVADDLAGTGFDASAGAGAKKILSGFLTSASGGFFRSTGANVPYDQFGSDNYSGLNTVSVVGGGSYEIQVTSTDPAFFDGSLPSNLSFVLTNSSDTTPFRQTNPSQLFSDGTNPTVVPNLGGINGTGPDFQAQADANASFDSPIGTPEPSSIVLGAIGLIGFSVIARRRAA
jgi:hypothetical protein